MALGTYDQEERKKKVVYNADGTTNEEKADRSVVAAAPVRDEEFKANPALSKAMPVTQTPQPQMAQAPLVQAPLSPLERKAVPAGVSDEVTPQQNSATNQGPQSNVNSGGDIKNNQGEVNQDTGTSLESQVGPASDAGGENMQWAGAPKGDVTSTYDNITNPPQPTPPLNAPVREFGGYNFSTVTPTGNTLSDADMDAYFNMLKKASEATGESIEALDKKAGGLLVGKSQQADSSAENPQQGTAKKNAEGTSNGSTGAPTNTNGTNKGTVANNANAAATSTGSTNNGTTGTPSKNTASTTTAPAVLTSEDYAKFSPSVLQTMAEIERDPMKKAMMQKAMQMQAQGASQPQGTATSTVKTPTGTVTNTPTGATATNARKFSKRQQARKDEAAQKMSNKDVYNGNVNLLDRKRVSGKEMRAAGYTDFPEDDYATLYSMQNGFRDKSKKGKVREILYTPIMADGTVLSQKDVDKYLTDLGKNGDILELDKPEKGGKGLVIAADVKGDLGPELHELQESYYSTPEDYAAKGKDAEIERDPMKKAMMQKAMQMQAQEASQPTAISGATSTQGTAASTEDKKTSALTDEEKKEKENARITLQEKYGSGNVNINKRPVVSEKQMHDKGWGGAVGDQSVYPQIVKIKDDKGNVRNVIMTPILPNGDILSPQEFKEYVQTFEGDDNFLSHDTHGIILKVDASDTDLDELDDLTKKALKGELVTDLDGDLENEYNPDNSPTRKKIVEAQESTQKKINELEALMSDPDKPLTSVALDEATKRLNEHDADTEKIKKRKKTAGIIANIGDILQGFANLAGTWYGAKSSDLTSLSAASNAGYERELTKREKRREELSKSIDSIKADLKKSKNTELSEWIKRLDEINKEIRKWDADAEKAYRNDKMKREQMRENTKQQNQRRAVEYAEKRAHAKYLSDLRKEEMGVRYGYSKDLKQTPPGKNPSSNKSNGGNKRGRGKTVDKMK